MNDRIFELANQVLPREDRLIEGDPKVYAYFFSSHELQQFAHLLVNKCAMIGNYAHDGGEYPGPMIKEYFGVE